MLYSSKVGGLYGYYTSERDHSLCYYDIIRHLTVYNFAM